MCVGYDSEGLEGSAKCLSHAKEDGASRLTGPSGLNFAEFKYVVHFDDQYQGKESEDEATLWRREGNPAS